MAKYHTSARGKIAQCRAKGECPLGGSASHYSKATIAMVSEKTYTPIKELKGKDVDQYITQEGLDKPFKGMKPGTDITDSYPVPVSNRWGDDVPLTAFFQLRKIITVDEDKSFMLFETRNSFNGSTKQVTGWLVQDKGKGPVGVGMINLMERTDHKYPYTVMSVEVRPEYRGQGLAKKITYGANTMTNGKIYTNGHYTPSGLKHLHGLFKMQDEQEVGPPGVHFDDMDFIEDWDNFVPPR